MAIPYLSSVKVIEQRFQTGEEPVLVLCSDRKSYICKYMRLSGSAYKLVCELIGTQLAQAWNLNTPNPAFVKIMTFHTAGLSIRNMSAPAFGTCRLMGVCDVTPSTSEQINASEKGFAQILKIALFDFWVANEDRNANNANLLYDIEHDELISIDYGCILNTCTFDCPLSQLTSTDTILYSDLFLHLKQKRDWSDAAAMLPELRNEYDDCIKNSKKRTIEILAALPTEWNVPKGKVEQKIKELYSETWIEGVWFNFVGRLKENM